MGVPRRGCGLSSARGLSGVAGEGALAEHWGVLEFGDQTVDVLVPLLMELRSH